MAQANFTVDDCSGCCVVCGTSVYGDTLILDFSGIAACSCTGAGQLEIGNLSLPPSAELTAISETTWQSPIAPEDRFGSADVYTGPNCENLNYTATGNFYAQASCIESGDDAGKLLIQIFFVANVGSGTAFYGVSDGLDVAVPSELVCGVLFGGGTATLSQP